MSTVKQPSLFGGDEGDPKAHARRNDPDTSHKAADGIANLSERRAAVLSVMRSIGRPMLDEEMEDAYMEAVRAGTAPHQGESGPRSRRSDLVKMGLVVDTGLRGIKRNGSKSILWAVTERAVETK